MKSIFLIFYLLSLSVFDLRKKSVPAVLLLAGLFAAVAGGLYGCARGGGSLPGSILELCLGLLPGAFLLLLAWLTKKVGWGDGVALLVVGLVTGHRACIALLCFSMLAAAAASVALLALRRANRETTLPYLPFLALTYLVGIFI